MAVKMIASSAVFVTNAIGDQVWVRLGRRAMLPAMKSTSQYMISHYALRWPFGLPDPVIGPSMAQIQYRNFAFAQPQTTELLWENLGEGF